MIRTEEEEQPTNINKNTTQQQNNTTTKLPRHLVLDYSITKLSQTQTTSDFVFNMKNTFSIFIYHFAVYYSYIEFKSFKHF